MMTPQLTEQYGQVLRVSEAREILRLAVWAYTGVRSNPRAESPTPPTRLLLRKVRRENSMSGPPFVRMNRTATLLKMPAKSWRFCEPSVYLRNTTTGEQEIAENISFRVPTVNCPMTQASLRGPR